MVNTVVVRSDKAKAIIVLANKLTEIAWLIVPSNDEFITNITFNSAELINRNSRQIKYTPSPRKV
ncbi:MAG: hypothetical protein ACJAS1_006753 [Oleiphilaceae bacterium]|jgi:hypothetical protein